MGAEEPQLVADLPPVLIRVEQLKIHFPITSGLLQRRVGAVKAVDGVSFDVLRGETLGLVGESGCGKTTTGRAILQVYPLTEGEVYLENTPLSQLRGGDLHKARKRMQMIFQDPFASLNPRMSVGDIVGEPLEIFGLAHGRQKKEHVRELFELVGLSSHFVDRYPHEFSGGQRQRVGIARAIALQPEFIVCDEPIAALDVSIQAQVVNLLENLQDRFGLTYLFIAHDLSMVRHISDRVAVMYLGKIVEMTTSDELYNQPIHPYTQALLSAVPIPDPDIEKQRSRMTLEGDLPSPANPPTGCNFHTRCPVAIEKCSQVEPEFRQITGNHQVACHLADGPGSLYSHPQT